MLLIVILVILFVIAYQDIRYRQVQWVLIALTGILNFFWGLHQIALAELLEYSIISFTFLLFNFSLIVLYLWVRFRVGLNKIFSEYLGVGDILFWMSIVPLFSTLNYISLHLLSLLASLIGFVILRLARISKINDSIPLAGLQAMFYSAILCATYFGWSFDFYNDRTTLQILGFAYQ